jgi:hypothetical protein
MNQDEKCLSSVLNWTGRVATSGGSKSHVWQAPATLSKLESILDNALNLPDIVVIVDAIDQGEHVREVVYVLTRLAKSGAKIFVTSRPDVTIRRAFETNKDQANNLKEIVTSQLDLSHDIQTYISIELDNLLHSGELMLRDPQLKPEIVKILTERSQAM